MKTGVKNLIKLLIFLAITGGCLVCAFRILSWKDTMGPYLSSTEQLYATPENHIDALFVGSSHCYAAVNPDVIWRDYGEAAFDMAISGQSKAETLHYTIEALKTQSPRVVVVDLLATTFEKGVVGNRYRNLLSMRTSRNQIDMVMAEPVDNKTDYLLKWPIIHTRYRELGPYDFLPNPYNSYGRGYCYRFRAEEVIHTPGLEDITDEVPISETNRKWIDDFVALSKKEDFSFLPVILPHEMNREEKEIYNGVLTYLDEIDIPYLDFNRMMGQLQLSYMTDFMDAGHLNYYGGEKVSDFFGEYLRENWDLPDHRGDGSYSQWDESLVYAEHLIARNELDAAGSAQAYLDGLKELGELTVVTRTKDEGGELRLSVTQEDNVLWDSSSSETEMFALDLDPVYVLSITLKENGLSADINGEPVFDDRNGTEIIVFDHRLGEPWEAHLFP